ncbi:DUF3006 family protein [Sporosarcina sp. Marseille-Q4943]|uniref:DUF3006 family protein n=1 Tax=Sporosarcina sp. Marseille-Q4943 TaxID=2942204 RepID=UPI00208DD00B|nr:DUF3006 family protein [Sporosarcina sp. Marseille-Q4943]
MRKMMEKKRYTLDRIDDVFLEYPREEEELLIPVSKISPKLSEGDVVCISKTDTDYVIEVLEDETEIMKDKVATLLEKLKNKK